MNTRQNTCVYVVGAGYEANITIEVGYEIQVSCCFGVYRSTFVNRVNVN